MGNILVAHRGESLKFPENTKIAFEKACRSGAHFLECDVQMSSDFKLVVIHDADLSRTTDQTGKVSNFSAEQLSKISAGFPERFGSRFENQTIPLLTDMFEFLGKNRYIQVEVKPESIDEMGVSKVIESLLNDIRSCNHPERLIIISFHKQFIAELKAAKPRLKCGFLIDKLPDGSSPSVIINEVWEELKCEFLIYNKSIILDAQIKEIFKPNPTVLVGVYTSDDHGEIEELFESGVDAIATNRFSDLKNMF